MNDLEQAKERISELNGNLTALEALASALAQELPPARRSRLLAAFQRGAETARVSMRSSTASEHTVAAFEREVERLGSLVGAHEQPAEQTRNP
ncbi:MAG TPA: hypothetical protein VEZ89_08450, partial [Rubrivivax sp.]|nr:hypothetical protein [Rubrivivax sp.]